MKNKKLLGLSFAILLSIACLFVAPNVALAYTATVYTTNNAPAVGTLVGFDHGNQIIPATPQTGFIGAITKQTATTAEVADSGYATVFVSDDNGADISAGDKISLSTIAGVGVRYETDSVQVGIANENISASSSLWHATTTSRTNSTAKLRVASLSVRLVTGGAAPATIDTSFMGSLQRVADSLAGHSVALWQLIASVSVGLGSLILAFGLLLSAARQSFTSIGRNPLASAVILRGMWRIVAVGIAIMLAGILTAYIILKVGA